MVLCWSRSVGAGGSAVLRGEVPHSTRRARGEAQAKARRGGEYRWENTTGTAIVLYGNRLRT